VRRPAKRADAASLSSSLSCQRSSVFTERLRSTPTAAATPGGRSGTSVRGLGKRVGFTPSRVRIPHPPLCNPDR
jgi:hypothetical protein